MNMRSQISAIAGQSRNIARDQECTSTKVGCRRTSTDSPRNVPSTSASKDERTASGQPPEAQQVLVNRLKSPSALYRKLRAV